VSVVAILYSLLDEWFLCQPLLVNNERKLLERTKLGDLCVCVGPTEYPAFLKIHHLSWPLHVHGVHNCILIDETRYMFRNKFVFISKMFGNKCLLSRETLFVYLS